MEDDAPPVSVSELLQLSSLGIYPHHITWSRVTMTSDAQICIRYDKKDGKGVKSRGPTQKQLMIVNLQSEVCSHKSWPMSPESAKVSPPSQIRNGVIEEPLLAIKTGDVLMVLRLEPSWEMVAKCNMEDIVYWTWLAARSIAIITDTTVYHWHFSQGLPDFMFTRHERLAFSEIINYCIDPSLRWLALTGLIPQEDSIAGVTQLYSIDNCLTQCISAHTVTFTRYCFEGNKCPSTTLCVASRDSGITETGKVHVVELGPHKSGNLAPCSHYDHVRFVDDDDRYDFPVALQVSVKYGLLYIVSKYGQLYVCDMNTAACLFSLRLSSDIIFSVTLNTATEGIIGICRNGQVLALDLKTERLVAYVRNKSHRVPQAERLHHVLVKHCTISGQSLI